MILIQIYKKRQDPILIEIGDKGIVAILYKVRNFPSAQLKIVCIKQLEAPLKFLTLL